MNTHVQLVQAPICVPVPVFFQDSGLTGSAIEFQGKVRKDEKGKAITGLFYEAYEDMAYKEIERLLLQLSSENPCSSAEVIHRLGWVPVNEVAIYVRILSAHRSQGFQLITRFLDRLKQDVPIWKSLAEP